MIITQLQLQVQDQLLEPLVGQTLIALQMVLKIHIVVIMGHQPTRMELMVIILI
jgi:hypothetical protein